MKLGERVILRAPAGLAGSEGTIVGADAREIGHPRRIFDFLVAIDKGGLVGVDALELEVLS